jgi:hypothetical protein
MARYDLSLSIPTAVSDHRLGNTMDLDLGACEIISEDNLKSNKS